MDTSNVKESIDERILRLLGLEDVFDLDYDTYLTLLKEAMVKGRMPKTTIPTEEIEALTDEYKRVKGKKNKGRFEVKKGKKINSTSFNLGKTKGLIAGSKSVKALPAAIGTSPVAKSLDDNISAITAAVVSIHETIKQQQNLLAGSLESDRRRREKEKGAAAENKLEKRFEGLKKIAEKIIAPVKSILDKIIDFLVNVLLGRVVIKLLDWLADPKNADKVKSIIRFLGDWGPALIGGFILFGTKFGKGIRVLTRIALSGIAKLAKAIPSLIRFARGNPKTALALAAGTYAGTQLAGRAFSGGENTSQKVEGRAGGGVIRIPKFAGGGFNNFFNGFVSGEKGVDKIPAMLSDGEFVMSRGAVAMYGVDTLEGMNAAGGGTNKPKLINGVPHAAGGGWIGDAYEGVNRASGGKLKPVVDEIIRGLSPQHKWANDLARKTGVSLSGVGNNLYNSVMNEGAKAHGYVTRGGMQGNLTNLGNQAVSSLQSNFNAVKEFSKNASSAIDNLGTGKRYKDMSEQNNKKSQESISKYDAWVQSLPKGFLRDTMNRGLIPIPTGNELGMTGLTYIKSMLGPLGRPFKILSNSVVDKARQEMIDRTAVANGMRVGANGKMSMEWNRVSGKGSGQYTDELNALGGSKSKGKFFNSTFGRWSGKQKGDKIVTDDVYNFNESVGYYGKKSKDALMKGNVGEGLYNIASMAGRFAQDIGWMNQRALGSEIEVGSVKNIDPKTGKPKVQIAKSKPVAKPIKPPAKPQAKVVYGPPVPSRLKGKTGGAPKSKVPNFTAGSPGMRSKTQTLGLMR